MTHPFPRIFGWQKTKFVWGRVLRGHTPFRYHGETQKMVQNPAFEKRHNGESPESEVAESQNRSRAPASFRMAKAAPVPVELGKRMRFCTHISMLVRAFPSHRISANEANNFLVGQNSLHAPPEP